MKLAVLTVCAVLVLAIIPGLASASTESHGSVNNHPPRVIQIDGLPESVIPLAGGERLITFSFMAKDANGWQDIVRAEVGLYAPDNSTFLREANVTGVSGGNGASHWFNATFSMWYYELPTSGENYTLHIRVLDQTGNWGPKRYAEFEYQELSAVSITTNTTSSDTNETEDPSLAFGDTAPGEESSTTELIIQNTGNVVVDVELYGTNLTSAEGYMIPVSSVRYALDGANMTNEQNLTLAPLALTSFDLPPGEDSSASIWWRLSLPSGNEQYLPAGTYDGSVTINAIAS